MKATRAQASRIVGCSPAQIAAWDRSGLVTASEDGDYAFVDLVALQVVRSLVDAGLSMAKIKRAVAYLREGGDDLASLRIVTDGDRVWACRDDGEILDALGRGQLALFVAVDQFVDDVASGVATFVAEREAFIDDLHGPDVLPAPDGRPAPSVGHGDDAATAT